MNYIVKRNREETHRTKSIGEAVIHASAMLSSWSKASFTSEPEPEVWVEDDYQLVYEAWIDRRVVKKGEEIFIETPVQFWSAQLSDFKLNDGFCPMPMNHAMFRGKVLYAVVNREMLPHDGQPDGE